MVDIEHDEKIQSITNIVFLIRDIVGIILGCVGIGFSLVWNVLK